MQHYGAPTRLLDWTYSFFAAAYFAIEDADEDAAIWALDADWFRDSSNYVILGRRKDGVDLLRQHGDQESAKNFDRYFRGSGCAIKAMVYPVNPFELHERLTIQQGLFLCPGDISVSFHSNLDALADLPGASGKFYKLILRKTYRSEILQILHRMNMSSATLFPGLDGFARSLRTKIAFEDLFVRGLVS